jgi:hypothetical protein
MNIKFRGFLCEKCENSPLKIACLVSAQNLFGWHIDAALFREIVHTL